MRVSQRLDYVVRAVVLLASRTHGEFMSGGEVAARLGLPQRVVEQQLSALARSGILRSRRGAGGGHALAREASLITVADVVKALQGFTLDVPRVSGSVSSELWDQADRALQAHLAGITIESLASRQRELDSAASESYMI